MLKKIRLTYVLLLVLLWSPYPMDKLVALELFAEDNSSKAGPPAVSFRKARRDFRVGRGPSSVTVADFNGDQIP
ncbi:MAG: hypothetical protein HYR55_14235, partial [Acidobacteria bacterium]|nr:hypothetical protein [Acidobacteriota bacterium]